MSLNGVAGRLQTFFVSFCDFLGTVKYHSCVNICNDGDIMPKSLTKTRKVGGSLVVTLPKKLVESQKIKEGEVVEVTVKKLRKAGFGSLKGIGPFTAEDEMDTHE